ncbi:hypothetical protein [Arenibacter palladensis]|nr:hypothetical protein [Arenibacter palladensis]
MEIFHGTWLMIKKGSDYCPPEFIEFENTQIIHFKLEKISVDGLTEKVHERNENFSETKCVFINENRIRIFRMGKTHTAISETESLTADTEFATDYERIRPTKTKLTAKKIQELEFEAEWNDEKFPFVFNKILDNPTINKINKRLNIEGQKLVLEKLQGTYFASMYENGERSTLIGIKEIDEEKAILFGFPETPYQITAK